MDEFRFHVLSTFIQHHAAELDYSLQIKYCVLSGSVAQLIKRLPADLRAGPGRVAQSVGHLTRKSGVLGSIPGLATYFRFSFRFFKKGSCHLLAKVCARSTG